MVNDVNINTEFAIHLLFSFFVITCGLVNPAWVTSLLLGVITFHFIFIAYRY